MGLFLGIDTSNYTTSLSLYDTASNQIMQQKKLLPVREGSLGLRQSDALFQHVKQLPALSQALWEMAPGKTLTAIGVSTQPRRQKDSYMPCFLAGESLAVSLGAALDAPVYRFSHQEGHVAAALYGSGHLDWMKRQFIAFHFSGGTSEGLMVYPEENRFRIQRIAGSLDLKAGQAVDRVGVMLGLPFPAGAALEALAAKSSRTFKVKPVMKGCDCSLSGVENKFRDMLSRKEAPEDIARFCLTFLSETLAEMTGAILKEYGSFPLLYAGGVMSNQYIRAQMEDRFGGIFCPPCYSGDNAAGVAVLAAQASQEDSHVG